MSTRVKVALSATVGVGILVGAAWFFGGLGGGGVAHAAPSWRFTPTAKDGPAKKILKQTGWEEQRGSWDDWRFKDGALHTHQDDSSTLVGHKVSLDPATSPMLRFTFQVNTHPAGADLRKKGTEDSALRIFVVFDRGGGLFSPPDSIAYAFGDGARKGKMFASDRFDNVKYMVVAGGAAELGKKITIERNVAEDYRKAFGKAPPKIKAIGIKSDSNNTDGKAWALIYNIEVGAP